MMIPNIYFIIPGGGIGTRMQASCPKQYLTLQDDKTVFETTVQVFLDASNITMGALGIAKEDTYFCELKNLNNYPDKLMTFEAGDTRSDTVFMGLKALKDIAKSDDWIIVHDAARPGLSVEELELFIEKVIQEKSSVGGIMALPTVDTVKQVTNHTITKTIDRSMIYLAQTPQMFRYQVLYDAYDKALSSKLPITDEASAIESMGYHPHVYEGYPHNFKITYPTDLRLMQFLLKERKLCE